MSYDCIIIDIVVLVIFKKWLLGITMITTILVNITITDY